MSSFHIVCKKRKDKSKTRQKVLIFASTSKTKGKRKRSEDPKKEAAKGSEQKKQSQENKCFFYNKTGHIKKEM